jgi:hypothetical protein
VVLWNRLGSVAEIENSEVGSGGTLVPEPSTYALLIAGLCATVVVAKRRKHWLNRPRPVLQLASRMPDWFSCGTHPAFQGGLNAGLRWDVAHQPGRPSPDRTAAWSR